MAPEDALRHLSNIRQLLKDLDARSAFIEVDRLYGEQLESLRGRDEVSRESTVEPIKYPFALTQPTARQRGDVAHGKYGALHRHLNTLVEDEWIATFQDVEVILERPLPRSARQHRPWWGNSRSHTHAKAWLDAGWRTRAVVLSRETLSFVRAGEPAMSATPHTRVPGLVHFDGDDSGYFAWLARNPNGYVVNIRRKRLPDYVVLHRTSCGHVANPTEVGAYTERDFGKLCGSTLTDVQHAPTYCGRAKGSFTKSVCALSPIARQAISRAGIVLSRSLRHMTPCVGA